MSKRAGWLWLMAVALIVSCAGVARPAMAVEPAVEQPRQSEDPETAALQAAKDREAVERERASRRVR